MTITLLLPPSTISRLLTTKQIICHDETHLHRSPIQNMMAIEINGHFVEITDDGGHFNARIDERLEGSDLTPEQLDQFIQEHT